MYDNTLKPDCERKKQSKLSTKIPFWQIWDSLTICKRRLYMSPNNSNTFLCRHQKTTNYTWLLSCRLVATLIFQWCLHKKNTKINFMITHGLYILYNQHHYGSRSHVQLLLNSLKFGIFNFSCQNKNSIWSPLLMNSIHCDEKMH